MDVDESEDVSSDKNRIKISIERLINDLIDSSKQYNSCTYFIVKGNRKSQMCGETITFIDPEMKYCPKHRRCTKSYKVEETIPEVMEKFIDFTTFRASCIELVI